MSTVEFTQSFQKKAASLVAAEPSLKKKLKKQFALFQLDSRHRGLKLHKLKGKRSEQYAIWIQGDLRALAVKDGDVFIFFDLVTHDQY